MENIDYSSHYVGIHGSDDRAYRNMARFYRDVLAHIPLRGRVLDVGCGTGFLVEALMREGHDVTGIDTDRGQVAVAQKRNLPVVHVESASVNAYVSSEQWDAIFLMDVLEHVPKASQLNLVSAIQKSLRPGGRFICEVPNALWSMARYMLYQDWTHQCLFTVSSLRFVLENAGFSQIEIQGREEMPARDRDGIAGILVPAARSASRGVAAAIWRLWASATMGPLGWTHPIKANLFAVAEKAKSGE